MEPNVEAGDRAVETARKIHAKCYMWARTFAHNVTGPEQIAEVAALIQSAMNAQEREVGTEGEMMSTQFPDVGTSVNCSVCGLRKKPIGRSAPLEMANILCDYECSGYYSEPKPGYLWPGETREEYGY